MAIVLNRECLFILTSRVLHCSVRNLTSLIAICVFRITPTYMKSPQVAWEEVRREMVEDKKLKPEVADRIGEYVKLNGKSELVEKLEKDAKLVEVKDAAIGLDGLKVLLGFCETMGISDHVSLQIHTQCC